MSVLLIYVFGFFVTFIICARHDTEPGAAWSTFVATFWPAALLILVAQHASVFWIWFWKTLVWGTLTFIHRQTLRRLRNLVYVGPKKGGG